MPGPARTTDTETGPSFFGFETSLDGGSVLVSLTGELDLAGVPALEGALDALTTADATVVIDLQRLEFIDASGARLLVRTHRRLRDAGGRMVLVGAGLPVTRVFDLVGLPCHSVADETTPARRRLWLV